MKQALSLTTAIAAFIALTACTAPQSHPDASARQSSMTTETTLHAHHWTLQTITAKGQAPKAAPAGLHGEPIVLNFAEQRVSVGGLCNVLSGGYTINDANINITHPVSTMKACPDEQLMRFEHEVGQRLPTAAHWNLLGANASRVLVLTFKDGTEWSLAGEPTAATRYGGEPKRIFLEVAPQRAACPHAVMPNHQCLKVREITYDDQGIKTGAGEWMFYYGTIEGFEHQPGVRNILRINRYTIKNPPADASSHADVLDMIIESETIAPAMPGQSNKSGIRLAH